MHYSGVGLEELLERYFASDDERAMAEVVRQTRGKLLVVARRISSADAEDAVQAAYLSLAKKGGLGGAPVLPWLLTAVARIAYRAKATRAREHAIAERLAPAAAPPEPPEIAIGKEEADLLRRELWKLPPDYRDSLQLRYLHGLSGAETARLLGINESTLRTRLQRGRLLLRSRLARALHPFLVLPWFLEDTRAAAAATLGGAMKAKLAIVALLLTVLVAFRVASREHAGVSRATPPHVGRAEGGSAGTGGPLSVAAATPEPENEAPPEAVTAEERQRYR
ncbi:MAG TPA: RNA polymerase sigma factor, partial [Vicinamibacteria bacterium]